MKILYSAFECNPYRGSEAYCGWSWIINMNKFHEIFVITRNENKADIEKFCKNNILNNVKFFYCDINNSINLYYKFGKFYMQYYVLWQRKAYKLAKKIVKQYDINIIHHITLGDFRVIGSMWKLTDNFFFGPVGGAQYIPKSLLKYAKKHKLKEFYRKAVNNFKTIDFRYKKAIKHTKNVFCANEETLFFLKKIDRGYNPDKFILFTENGINVIYPKKDENEKKKIINIIWIGRIVYRKGLEFLIDCIPMIKTIRKFNIFIYGKDQENEIPNLKKKIKEYNLEGKVFFKGEILHTQIDNIYKDADIFVFPSLRETTGTVIFEAMAHGIPIVSFKQNGVKLIANDKTSILIDVNDSNIKLSYANAIKKLVEDDEYRNTLSKNSLLEVEKYYWSNKAKYMNDIYRNIMIKKEIKYK